MTNNEEYLLDRLPLWLPESDENKQLLRPVAKEIDRFESDRDSVENATHVNKAETIPQLNEKARLVDLKRKEGESLEKFRKRVILEYGKTTNEATPFDLLYGVAAAIGQNINSVEISNLNDGLLEVRLPSSVVENAPLNKSEISNFLEQIIAAGFNVAIIEVGSFSYISSTDYNNSNFTPDHGYASVANPDSGGVYSGTLG